jgi:squalene synthase HpnC
VPPNVATTTILRPVPSPLVPADVDVLGRARSENFPVALRLLPVRVRRQLTAVYGVARLADQIGDELAGDRLAALDWLDTEVELAFAGRATHPLLVALSRAAREVELPEQPFHDLVEANRADQRVSRYATVADLLGYCALSANPIGRLVLGVFGAATPERIALSDRVCTGLQVVEHCQDVREDLLVGRVYLPQEDLRRFDVDESELAASTASPAVRALLCFGVARARIWLADGVPLVAGMRGWARLAVAGFVAGGFATCDRIAAADYDVLAEDTAPHRAAILAHGATLWRGSSARR